MRDWEIFYCLRTASQRGNSWASGSYLTVLTSLTVKTSATRGPQQIGGKIRENAKKYIYIEIYIFWKIKSCYHYYYYYKIKFIIIYNISESYFFSSHYKLSVLTFNIESNGMVKDLKYKCKYYCINKCKEIYSGVLFYLFILTFAVVLSMGFLKTPARS